MPEGSDDGIGSGLTGVAGVVAMRRSGNGRGRVSPLRKPVRVVV